MCVIILSENKPAAERNIWYDSICYEEFFFKVKKNDRYVYADKDGDLLIWGARNIDMCIYPFNFSP